VHEFTVSPQCVVLPASDNTSSLATLTLTELTKDVTVPYTAGTVQAAAMGVLLPTLGTHGAARDSSAGLVEIELASCER
jgi:hypothetical protein